MTAPTTAKTTAKTTATEALPVGPLAPEPAPADIEHPSQPAPPKSNNEPNTPKPQGTTPKRGRPPGRPSKNESAIEDRTRRVTVAYEQLAALLILAGLGIGNERMTSTGFAFESNAAAAGAAWAQWADQSPRVARLVDSLSSGGVATAVLMAHIPIVRALMSPTSSTDQLGGLLGDTNPADLANMFAAFTAEPS